MGRKAELGHVLVKFRDQLAPRGSLTCLDVAPSHWVTLTDGLNRTTASRCGPAAPVLQSCVPMSAIKFSLVISEPVYQRRYCSPDARYRFTWMGEEELGHVLEKQKNDKWGCVGLTKRYCIKVWPNGSVLPELRRCPRSPRHFRT
jgi:hypothetical protein